MNEKSFSDIQTKAWFDRYLPKWVYPYARLARWDRPVGVWLLFLPCLWGMFLALPKADVSWSLFMAYTVLFFIGSVVMRGAGCTINDLWDRDLDRQVTRTQNRPLASGALTIKQALVFLLFQLLCGAVIIFQLNGTAIFIGLLSLPLVALYPLMKRWTWWPQVFLGFTFNWGVLVAGTAIYGTLTSSLFWLYGGAIFWTIAYDTIYAFQDIDDDALIGVRSTAQLFGSKTKPILTGVYLGMGLCFSMAIGFGGIGFLVWFWTVLHIIQLHRFWQMSDSYSSLNAFKNHIYFGWAMVGILTLKYVLTV